MKPRVLFDVLRSLPALVAIASVMMPFPALASGGPLVEGTDDFSVKLAAPNVATCFFLPEARSSLGDCAGFDPVVARGWVQGVTGRQKLLAGAALRQDPHETIVLVLDTGTKLGPVGEGQLASIATSLMKGVQATPPIDQQKSSPPELLRLGELQVIHLQSAQQPSKELPDLLFLDHYYVLTAETTKLLVFMTFSPGKDAFAPVIAEVVQTIRGRPVVALEKDHSAEEWGYTWGTSIVILLTLVIGAGVSVALVRRFSASRSDN